jgi:hypothetical protein
MLDDQKIREKYREQIRKKKFKDNMKRSKSSLGMCEAQLISSMQPIKTGYLVYS